MVEKSNLGTYLKRLVAKKRAHILNSVQTKKTFHAKIMHERALADRNRHSFSLVLFNISNIKSSIDCKGCLIDVIFKRIRQTDGVGWFDNENIGVLLPYTSTTGAQRLADDIYHMIDIKTRPSDCNIYTYPNRWLSNGNGKSVQLYFSDLLDGWNKIAPRQISIVECSDDKNKIFSDILDNVILSSLNPMPFWKKTIDILCALFGIVILSPVLFTIALFIKISSTGPVFYKQQRVGHNGKLFTMLKFRSMELNNDSTIHRKHMSKLINGHRASGSYKPMAKVDHKSQITFIGKILRTISLDELPQLFNILRGEMSLVGPRPPTVYEAREYSQWHYERFLAVPGITGLWQVSGKNRLTFPKMIRLDVHYLRNLSLWLDIKIILKTPLAIFSDIKDSYLSNGKPIPYMGVTENA